MTIVDIEIGNMCSFFREITSRIYIFQMEIKYLCIILSRSNIFVFQIDFCDSQPKKKKQFAQCFFYWFKMPSHITFCWFIEHVFS
jgi:hypothetical protein